MRDSLDDLDTPLHAVTFCVVDVETTGGSPATGAITEIGAARFRGGECLGTLQTLVDPGMPVPPEIAVLTGITGAMLLPAPPIDEVLPSLLEFAGGAVLVGHNLRFDTAFLDAALAAGGRPPLGQRRVDTVALARRLVRDDVADCRLHTLADRFGLDHRPRHRALDDALATADLLHVLLERAAAFGTFCLDDLLALPRLAGHPQAAKLGLTARLPRAPGVYVFRDRQGRALRVGRAANLRSRVRSYFAGASSAPGDGRRNTGSLLRETHAIDHVPCASPLAAAVLEVRLIHALEPRYNRRGARWRSYRYVTLTDERSPRLVVSRGTRNQGTARLGPLPSTGAARQVIEAIESAMLLGCGTEPPGESGDRELASAVARGLGGQPDRLLRPLAHRVQALAADERYPQAAATRAQAAALVRALRRQRQFDRLRRAGRVVLELPGGGGVELVRGRLLRAWEADGLADGPVPGRRAERAGRRTAGRAGAGSQQLARWLSSDAVEPPPADGPVPLEAADELACVAAWLDRHADRLRPVHVDGELSSPLPRLPSPAHSPPAPPAAPRSLCSSGC